MLQKNNFGSPARLRRRRKIFFYIQSITSGHSKPSNFALSLHDHRAAFSRDRWASLPNQYFAEFE
jgi:hypothetical protein